MLFFAFFSAVFSSASWLIYAVMFVRSRLDGAALFEQDPQTMLTLVTVVVLPILAVWMIFGYFNQFLINRVMNIKQSQLLTQLQKNQDYTDLVVRVMLDAEHEIKDGFVLNKFDVFITDMNETLGEIIQRCNIASSAQLDQLWQRVRRGEKWTLGKAILDASKNQNTFDAWVREKANRDKVFRGSLLEFCSRYQNLLQMLEKHDRDKIFLRMIETGVFGKVYSIIAPLSDGIKDLSVQQVERAPQSTETQRDSKDYTSVLKLATMQEPKAEETIVNVDRDDEEIEEQRIDEQEEQTERRPSFLERLNPFRSKEPEHPFMLDDEQPDPFFQALHNSFQGDGRMPTIEQPSLSGNGETVENEPSFVAQEPEPRMVQSASFGNLQHTLDSLRANNENISAGQAIRQSEAHLSAVQYAQAGYGEPAMSANEQVAAPQTEEKDEDLVYPFGGWTDESNYNG